MGQLRTLARLKRRSTGPKERRKESELARDELTRDELVCPAASVSCRQRVSLFGQWRAVESARGARQKSRRAEEQKMLVLVGRARAEPVDARQATLLSLGHSHALLGPR